MTRRVAVTGMGLVCGLGDEVERVWHRLLDGQSGISFIEQMDTGDLPVNIAGEVKNFQLSEGLLPLKDQGHYDRFTLFALYAADRALAQANLKGDDGRVPDGCATAAILGVGMGGMPVIEKNYQLYLQRGSRRVSPFFVPAEIPNMAPGLIAIRYGIRGANYAIASACASSAHAIAAAADEIRLGRHRVVVAGGAEAVISKLSISGFANMKALSRRNQNPGEASRPFDRERDGFVMGEGAGVLALEDWESARERGAPILAEVVGHASSSDAYHATAPHPEGPGARQCMHLALKDAGIGPEQVGYINAHGTATPQGDLAETVAVKEVFGEHAHRLAISSSKSMTGHLLGAAGGLESIFCVQALRTGHLPPTANLDNPDPDCDLNYLPRQSVERRVDYALNNSFGFGGTNCSLVFKRYVEEEA